MSSYRRERSGTGAAESPSARMEAARILAVWFAGHCIQLRSWQTGVVSLSVAERQLSTLGQRSVMRPEQMMIQVASDHSEEARL